MPPKGWRKNAEGQYPQPSSKENELISIDDILFPRTTIQKLAKNIISDDENNAALMTIAKDSLLALQRSATVFVSHMFFQAKEIAKEANRKTVSAQDMLGALERAEFSGFLPEVKQKLTQFETLAAAKRLLKANGGPVKEPEVVEESDKKRLKVNESSGTSVSKKKDTDDDDEEEEEDEDDDATKDEEDDEEGDEATAAGADEDEDMDVDDEEEEVEVNPIAALAREEDELEGADTEDKNSTTENEEDDEDDD
ncbi:DNA polymerase epsilon subunit D [Candida viswanathii]|uniref:DNA polymerase epsilon subunit D n=1 Tax=Candida viswanathii TaxID=5486 RepID=A0A367XLT2_9ASCO|nr:DNA polymerase epsilon subunit D [Candida viswanathii]